MSLRRVKRETASYFAHIKYPFGTMGEFRSPGLPDQQRPLDERTNTGIGRNLDATGSFEVYLVDTNVIVNRAKLIRVLHRSTELLNGLNTISPHSTTPLPTFLQKVPDMFGESSVDKDDLLGDLLTQPLPVSEQVIEAATEDRLSPTSDLMQVETSADLMQDGECTSTDQPKDLFDSKTGSRLGIADALQKHRKSTRLTNKSSIPVRTTPLRKSLRTPKKKKFYGNP